MKGGIGTFSIKLPNGLTVAAIVAVNCVGDVIDRKTGRIIAGVNIIEKYRSGETAAASPRLGENTTIGVIATNAAFNKTQMTKIAEMAHDGLARVINPAHTPWDGDTLFALSTGTSNVNASHGIIGALAAEAVAEAIIRAVPQGEQK
jgi:L-aminopeptidase/D-esterase-like protein